MPAKWTEGYVSGPEGVKIYYTLLRKGLPWLVFLHGGTGSMSALFKLKNFFSNKGFSLLFVDLRAHGNSDRGDGPGFYRIENFANDLDAVLGKLGIKSAVVIGHCFGGFVAQEFAARFPDRIQKLILLSSGDGGRRRSGERRGGKECRSRW